MPTKTIYLNDTNYELCKQLPNVSGTINDLLQGYFEDQFPKEKDARKPVEQVLEEKTKVIEETKKEVETIQEEVKTKEEIRNSKLDQLIDDAILFFPTLCGREMSKIEQDEYRLLTKIGEISTLLDYCKFKGFLLPPVPKDDKTHRP